MDSSAGDQRQEIQSSLRSIVDTAEAWLGRLKRRQFQVRLITSLVVLVLVFFGTLIVDALALIFSANLFSTSGSALSINFGNYIQLHPDVLFRIAGPAFLTGPISAIITYVILKWRQGSRTKELSSLISKMKKRLEEYGSQNTSQDQQGGIVEDAFSLTDQILTILPKLARKKTLDSWFLGFGAFILALLVSQNPGVALLVGVAILLYSRYETSKSFERDIAKFEEQKKTFDQRKDAFLATL